MRLKVDQLPSHLGKTLAPVYLISGDEPLQLGEAADTVRARARALGHSDRQVMHVDAGFDWRILTTVSDSLSLFAEKRILELRMPSAKPGNEGGQALVHYGSRPPADALLLILCGKLDGTALKSQWFRSLDKVGVVIQVWPVEPARLPAWITQRMRARGLEPDRASAQLLAERVEGNLLAAAQEIDKLALLHGNGPVNAQDVAVSVADSARFDVFALLDSALLGDAGRTLRVLNGLRAEGTRPIQILGLLAFEIRRLCALAFTSLSGWQPLDALFVQHRIWGTRKDAIRQGLKRHGLKVWQQLLVRCAHADRVVKGMASGEAWDELLGLCMQIAGPGERAGSR